MANCVMTVSNEAWLLREATGTSAVAEAARTLAVVLARYDIAHLIAGGLAVQEHGYPRVTTDVDVIVPDVLEAAEFGTADVSGDLARVPAIPDRLKDKRTGVIIDLLPAGKVLKAGCKVPFPTPAVVSDCLQFITLEELISLKLDSWANSPLRRLRDKTDVVELIIRRNLSRDLSIGQAVRDLYRETWDALQAEK
jgi:hypothetical protein